MKTRTDHLDRLSKRYLRFAVEEARGSSPDYERLASTIAETPEILQFIAALPPERQQPNLFLAAVRLVAGVPQDNDGLIDVIRKQAPDVRHLMISRTTQTNEPARCAVLLPVLAKLPQPLALLEIGASAGLCLMPDRYGYDYGAVSHMPDATAGPPPPIFSCRANDTTPLPETLPVVAWRRGLDLNPMDINSDADVAWLETLVWPGQADRIARLRAAVEVARTTPPRVDRGDLFADLETLVDAAPKDATLVIFHSAVLGYVPDQLQRDKFVLDMQAAPATWISNESPHVFPSLASDFPESEVRGRFLLSVDGTPVAWTGPHGQSIEWFGPPGLPA